MQGSFQYDTTVVKFIEAKSMALQVSNLPGFNYNIPPPGGVIVFSWNLNSGSATVADNAGLFQLCFKGIGPIGSVSPIRLTDTLVNPIDVYNKDGVQMGVTTVTGSVTIRSANFTVRVVSDSVRCNGSSTGGFRIVPTGSGFPWLYSWQNATNPGQNGYRNNSNG